MKAISILMALSAISDLTSSTHNMDPYITCWENNRFSYRGYHDPGYVNDSRYIADGGEGDVCDHTDNNFNEVRDTCYFQVFLGAEVWTYKCMHHNECPLKDPVTGEGIMGCKNMTNVGNPRITCCCNEDKCNGAEYLGYAQLGYAENWTPSATQDRSNKPGTGQDTDTDTDTDGDTLYGQENDNDESQLSIEQCEITEAEGTPCSCGGSCSSTQYSYTATTDKCGNQELITGEFGEETCNPSNPVYEVGETVQCEVTDCTNGEFRILSHGNRLYLSGLATLMIIFVCYKLAM